MANEPTPVTITILGREYRVACTQEEEKGLLDSAHYLDAKMTEIRGRGRTQGMENVAVMAALNIAHELLMVGANQYDVSVGDEPHRLNRMREKIEDVLADSQPPIDIID